MKKLPNDRRVGIVGERVADQSGAEGKGRIPVGDALVARFLLDVLEQHQRLAAAVDVAEMLETVAEGVADRLAGLDMDRSAAAWSA